MLERFDDRWAKAPHPLRAAFCAFALGAVLYAPPAAAAELGDDEFQVRIDTTLSHGLSFRIEDRSDRLLSDANGDDGNRNYDRGLISNTSKITSDIEFIWDNLSAFARVNGFYDFENADGKRDRTRLSDAARNRVGRDIELLDLYVAGAFDLEGAALDLRLGNQVLNWGESTFIQNGINAINPFDVGKLRLPGAELREALQPVPLISASVSTDTNLTVEGFYQLAWEETEIDPVGSYFSVIDYAGPGASRVVIPLPGLEGLGDTGLTEENNPFGPLGIGPDPGFLNVMRGPDRNPGDSGQWGIAFRYLAEALNDTEFGFYFMNYHSRLPVVSVHTGTSERAQAGLARVGGLAEAAGEVAGEAAVNTVIQRAIGTALMDPSTGAPIARALLMNSDGLAAAMRVPGFDPTAPTPAHIQAALQAAPQAAAEIVLMNQATAEAVREAAQTAGATAATRTVMQAAPIGINEYAEAEAEVETGGHYFVEYPEDIQLLGVSFNTELGTSGWALQGEYSFRRDAPLQIAEDALIERALAPFTSCLTGLTDIAGCISDRADQYDADIRGYILRDVSQAQVTATKVFGPRLGADSAAFLTEVAVMRVHNMPGSGDTPLESPAGAVGGDTNDADATSWGYRLAARLDYNNAIGAVNLFPYAQFQHDVGGNSPSPIGPFVEGRTAVTLGVRASYLARWEADLNVTTYGGKANELNDRDFVTVTFKYSF